MEKIDGVNQQTFIARSSYSPDITITAKPQAIITAPSMRSGPDYATEVMMNPWDMEDEADIANLDAISQFKAFENEVFAGGVFSADAIVLPGAPQGQSDSQVWFNVAPSTPIATSRYRYFSFEMELDDTEYSDIGDKVSNGWVARVAWWEAGLAEDGSQTNDIILYEGRNRYTIDLADLDILEPDAALPAQTGWLGNAVLSHLRLDTTEVYIPTRFTLYEASLRAVPAITSAGLYTIDFEVTDDDSELVSLSFYTDGDNTGFDGQLVGGPFEFVPGKHRVTVDLSSTEGSSTYIYLVLDDGNSVTKRYADVPVDLNDTQDIANAPPMQPVVQNIEATISSLQVLVSKGNPSESVDSFSVSCSDGADSNITVQSLEAAVSVTGLSSNTVYYCSAIAINDAGSSPPSIAVEGALLLDSDGDGIPDGQDDYPYDAANGDADSDGLQDHIELELGTDPTNSDSDNDGYLDGDEVESGSDPLDPLDVPLSSALPIWLLIEKASYRASLQNN